MNNEDGDNSLKKSDEYDHDDDNSGDDMLIQYTSNLYINAF